MGPHVTALVVSLLAGLGPPQKLVEPLAAACHPDVALLGDSALVGYGDGVQVRLKLVGDLDSGPIVQGREPQVRPRLAIGPLGALLISYYTPDPEVPSLWALWVVARDVGVYGAPQRLASRLPEPRPQALVLRSRGGHGIAWERTGPAGQAGVHLVAGSINLFIAQASEPRLAEDEAGFLVLAYLRSGRVHYRRERDDAALEVEQGLAAPIEATGLDAAIGPAGALHLLCATSAGLEHVAVDGEEVATAVPGSSGATGARLAVLPDGALGIVFQRGGQLHFVRRDASFGPVEPVPESAAARSWTLAAGAPPSDGASAPYCLLIFDTDRGVYYSSDAAPPVARFRASSTAVSQGEPVVLEDLSSGVVYDRAWDFGDGTTYRGEHPRHRYAHPGAFRVKLVATGPGGKSSFELDQPIRVQTAADLLRFPEVVVRPGDGDVRVPLLLTSSAAVRGFQTVFRVPAPLVPGEILFQGTRTQLLEPELQSVDRFQEADGVVIVVAALWDYLFPFDGRRLPPGEDQALFLCELAITAAAASGSSVPLPLIDEDEALEKASLIVTENGQSLFPFLIDGKVSIVSDPGLPFVRGDANGDRHVDISDAIWMLAYLFLGERRPVCHDAADKNDDGILDVSDPIDLLQYLFAGAVEFPAYPFPTPGFDGTVDPLPPCEGP